MKVLCADIIQVTSVTWQHLSLVNSPYSDDFLQFTITAWLTTYLEDVTEDLCPLWEYSFRRWDVNIMVGVVYKCTLNLVSPAPVSTDWLSASVLSALPPSQLARATCQASVATATRSKASIARAQTGSAPGPSDTSVLLYCDGFMPIEYFTSFANTNCKIFDVQTWLTEYSMK